MTKRYVLEVLDGSLKYFLDCGVLFGEKMMILGGEFSCNCSKRYKDTNDLCMYC